jgi:predicted dehydrogenase
VKAAVVGTGNIARQHLAALKELPGVSIAAVCDLSRTAAEATAERFGVPRWYTDHRSLLDDAAPDVVHVTTPPHAHLPVALDALDAGAHVVVEKPAAPTYEEVEALVDRARQRRRALIEDYNYLFNAPVRRLLELVRAGALGAVVHVELTLCLDPDEGGAQADFLSHLASLVHALVGPHRHVSRAGAGGEELRALVEAEAATAAVWFSLRGRPDLFVVRVHGERGRATANLFEPALVVERDRPVPRPLVPLVNGLDQAWTLGQAAVGSFWQKLAGGPGSYEGLWEHLRVTYEALERGTEPPVTPAQVLAVNRLVADLGDPGSP